jgi:hypothetical protein
MNSPQPAPFAPTPPTASSDIFPLMAQGIHVNFSLGSMSHPGKSDSDGEVSQNVTTNQTQEKRKRGGQEGNRNARKHGFYSTALSPAQMQEVQNITNLEGVDSELALIRVKLQSSLQRDPGNRRVIREASRLIVKWYSENYGLDTTTRGYLKTVVDNILQTAAVRQAARPQT